MLRLVTVATGQEGYFDYLVKSCKRHGIFLEVLGMGQKWEGLNWKFLMVQKYLEKIPDHELVCFVDAYDVVVTSNACEMMKRFWDLTSKYNAKIIAGCENSTNPLVKWGAQHVFGLCKDKMLNSGTYMGQVKDLKKVVSIILNLSKNPQDNDQTLMTTACSIHPDLIYIDDKNEIFLTINSSFSKVHVPIVNGEIVLPSGARPCILHANGNTRIDHVLVELGYPVPEEFVRYLDEFNRGALTKKIVQYAKDFFDHTWIWIVLLILVVIYFLNR
jgi:hypothetical protein